VQHESVCQIAGTVPPLKGGKSMSAAVMMERIAEVSPRFKARMAGVLYLLSVLTATFTELFAEVDEVHARAMERGLRIVYPLTDEPWGIRRFLVVDPNGVIVNVSSHLQR